jgi:CSLREA domain-containing protein
MDGTTQSGWTLTPVVEIDGQLAGGSARGLQITGDNTEIRGLAIGRFTDQGIYVGATAANTLIAGNHIGTDASGTLDRGNGNTAIDLTSGSGPTTVGGTTLADRNVLSGNDASGMTIWNSDGNTVIGNYISGNGEDGIEITDVSTANVIVGNVIGIGRNGADAVPNGRHGVVLYNGANNTVVGGAGAGEANVISANPTTGVVIDANGGATTTGNVLQGNYIGTDITGTLDRGNGSHGVHLFNGATGNDIGGVNAGEGNLISGNGSRGVLIEDVGSDSNKVEGNLIGTNAAGTAPLANQTGVFIQDGAKSNTIGGTVAGARNILSGNTEDGVYVTSTGTDSNVIAGNYIGTDINGSAAIPNGDRGVQIESGAANTTVGGGTAGAGNVISGNTGDGIIVADWLSLGTTGAVIQGNYIGVQADGVSPLGNGNKGVHIDPVSGNLIGGIGANDGNIIAYNGQDGVTLNPVAGGDNTILGNSIYANTDLGIDLNNNGVTSNDAGDADAGPNDLLNFPVITSAVESGGTITIDFDLDVPAGDYRIEFFDNTAADGTGYGEGEAWVDSYDVVTHPGGLASYSTTIAGTAGDIITATTTEAIAAPFGSTSEFSLAYTASDGVFTVNSTGDAGDTNVGDGVCYTGGSNSETNAECTLRAAIEEANFGASADTIDFNMPATEPGHSGGIWTITPTSPYNDIRQTVSIDATTQPGFVSDPIVQLDGSDPGAAGATAALTLEANNSLIEGFIVHSWGDEGLEIDASTGKGDNNTLRNNWVGIDSTQTPRLIGDAAILITVGAGGNTVDGNVVVNATSAGIWIRNAGSDNNVIVGNSIGVAPDGVTAIPNTLEGIVIEDGAANNRIGGTTAADANVIANNGSDGIDLKATAGSGNAILRNSIHSNGGLGIDIDPIGVNPNDGGDIDGGPNDRLNYPVITSATESGGTVTVDFDLDVPAGNYRIELFVNPSGADPSGNGEGETWVDSYNVIAHPGGPASYSTTISGAVNDVLTATATEQVVAPFGSTSEFSATHTVTPFDNTPPVITLVGANPQTIEVGSPYVELGATALDDVDGDVTGDIVIDATAVNTAVLGSYSVTYDVSDAAGNAATTVTRTVDVVDTTVPVITLVGADPQTIEVGSPYVELGATATDNYDGDLTGSIIIDATAVNTAVRRSPIHRSRQSLRGVGGDCARQL